MEYVRSHYGIDVPVDEPEAATDIWLDGRKGVTVHHGGNGFDVRGPALINGSACHLLGQRIVARGRIMLLEKMERILDRAPDVQICYTNIDSIHFSLPTIHRDSIVAWLEREASDEMGSFKVEAVTQHGLWLEPGRYWLYSDSEIVKFRNRSVGDRQRPFNDHSIHVANRQIGGLHVPIKMTLDLERTISPLRSVDTDGKENQTRQRLIEVGENTRFSYVLDEIERNQRLAIPVRMQAFRRLRERMMPSCTAASVQEE